MKNNAPNTKPCNCRTKSKCPLNCQCKSQDITYKCTVSISVNPDRESIFRNNRGRLQEMLSQPYERCKLPTQGRIVK